MLRRIALIAALGALTTTGAEAADWSVDHVRPASARAGEALNLRFVVDPADQVGYAAVYLRAPGESKFRAVVVRPGSELGVFEAVVDAERVQVGELKYFLRIVDNAGSTHDVLGSAGRALVVQVLPVPDETMSGGGDLDLGDALAGLDLSSLNALEAEFQLLQAEDVVISASKYTQSIIEAPAAIYVLSRDDMIGYGFRDLADALRFVPGVQVARVNESTPLIGVRGFADESNNLVLFLEQGRELNVELFGAAMLASQSFNLDDLERVEVIRGPGSALYGANAFSGVVQLIPKQAGSYERRFRLLVDRDVLHGGSRAEMRAAGVTGETQYRVSGHYREEGSASDAGARGLRRVASRGRFDTELGEIPLRAEIGGSALRGELFSVLGETPAEMVQTELALGTQVGPVRVLGYWNHWDAVLGVADPILAQRLPQLRWDTDTLNLDALADVQLGEIDRLTVGGNIRWNRFASPEMVEPSTDEIRAGVFLQNELRVWEHFILNVGLRSDFSTLYQPDGAIGDRLTLSPRAAAIFPINDDHGVRASFGTAFRKPSFFEQNAEFTALVATRENVSNAELVNEQILSGELGYVGRAGAVRWTADLFYNIYRDFIEFAPSQRYENQDPDVDGSTSSLGGELALRWRILSDLAMFANYGYVAITLERPDLLAPGNPIVTETITPSPQHSVNGGVRYGKDLGPQAAVALHWQSDFLARLTNPEKGSILLTSTESLPIDSYLNFFARVAWRFEHWELGMIGEQAQADLHTEYPGLDGVATPDGLAPAPAGSRYGGERLPPRGYIYVEGSF